MQRIYQTILSFFFLSVCSEYCTSTTFVIHAVEVQYSAQTDKEKRKIKLFDIFSAYYLHMNSLLKVTFCTSLKVSFYFFVSNEWLMN
jgi:hypothetical protein